jgi:cephalosporin-C deacetylase
MKNRITRLFLQSMLLIALSFNVLSQPATSLVKVIVSCDHKDWTYKVNEVATFSVQVLKYGNLMDNVTINYEAGPESMGRS